MSRASAWAAIGRSPKSAPGTTPRTRKRSRSSSGAVRATGNASLPECHTNAPTGTTLRSLSRTPRPRCSRSGIFLSGGGNDFAGWTEMRKPLKADCGPETTAEGCFMLLRRQAVTAGDAAAPRTGRAKSRRRLRLSQPGWRSSQKLLRCRGCGRERPAGLRPPGSRSAGRSRPQSRGIRCLELRNAALLPSPRPVLHDLQLRYGLRRVAP